MISCQQMCPPCDVLALGLGDVLFLCGELLAFHQVYSYVVYCSYVVNMLAFHQVYSYVYNKMCFLQSLTISKDRHDVYHVILCLCYLNQ